MKRILLTVEYDGTAYAGWQRQINGLAVQQVLEDRRNLEEAMGTTIRGLAYPNGSYDDQVVDVLKVCGIVHARTVTSTISLPSER